LFPDISDASAVTSGNMRVGDKKVSLRPLIPPRCRASTPRAFTTSISATSSSSYQSPLLQLQAELQPEVNSGAISSLIGARINSSLQDRTSAPTAANGHPPFREREAWLS
jgi:hypothetical protein